MRAPKATGPPSVTICPTRSNPDETAIGVDTVGDLEMQWEHTGTEVTSTPAIVGGVVYFADWAGVIYAKNVLDGSEVWTSQLEDSGVETDSTAGDTLGVTAIPVRP